MEKKCSIGMEISKTQERAETTKAKMTQSRINRKSFLLFSLVSVDAFLFFMEYMYGGSTAKTLFLQNFCSSSSQSCFSSSGFVSSQYFGHERASVQCQQSFPKETIWPLSGHMTLAIACLLIILSIQPFSSSSLIQRIKPLDYVVCEKQLLG